MGVVERLNLLYLFCVLLDPILLHDNRIPKCPGLRLGAVQGEGGEGGEGVALIHIILILLTLTTGMTL